MSRRSTRKQHDAGCLALLLKRPEGSLGRLDLRLLLPERKWAKFPAPGENPN